MFGECHMHMFMNGENYRRAVELHRNGVQEDDIRRKLQQYRDMGITFLRDGGDALGVSAFAAALAPEYGITYRTPLFAIHRNGHYGGIVGFGFDTWEEYHALVKRVKAEGGDFIKVMFSGIMDFGTDGSVSEEPLPPEDIRRMIGIAHDEGMAVMAHVNGARTVQAAVEAGLDSVEHGNFVDEECLHAMAESHAVWIPTFVTITNLIGSGRFDDKVIRSLKKRQGSMIREGFRLGVKIGLGSDAGAYRVMHGQGVYDEYREFCSLLGISEAGSRDGNAAGVTDRTRMSGNTDREADTESMTGIIDCVPHLPVMKKGELDHRLAEAETLIRRKFSYRG